MPMQDHYDFGMRAVKSVLVMAGALKRANPDLSEDVVLIRAMRDSNLPKFLVSALALRALGLGGPVACNAARPHRSLQWFFTWEQNPRRCTTPASQP